MNHLVFNKKISNFDIIFDKTGALFIKDNKTLVLADLHLGKSVSLNRTGNYVPLYDNEETIKSLKDIILKYNPLKIITLGDSFHDKFSIMNMNKQHLSELKKITQNFNFIWITGNHDKNLLGIEKLNGTFLDNFSKENLRFTHIKTNSKSSKTFEFSGHYHPKTYLRINNSRYYYKCFVIGKNFCILPSFGYYTGGIDVRSEIFSEIKNEYIELIVLGKRKIIHQKFKL